jgi:ABC-type uncharacterized transport system substrate-binding protein
VHRRHRNIRANLGVLYEPLPDLAQAVWKGVDMRTIVSATSFRKPAEKTRLPAIYPFKEIVQGGGLMSYRIDLPDVGRRVADMASQILKGAKPSDRPPFSGRPSLTGHFGHGWTCSLPRPVAI